jgi:hypothetical protein
MLDLNRCLKIDTGVSVILIYPGNLHSTYRTYTGIYFFLVFFSFFSFFFLSQATIFFFFFCSFYYGSHYSSMGIVLYYLLRLEPCTSLHRNLQVLIDDIMS